MVLAGTPSALVQSLLTSTKVGKESSRFQRALRPRVRQREESRGRPIRLQRELEVLKRRCDATPLQRRCKIVESELAVILTAGRFSSDWNACCNAVSCGSSVSEDQQAIRRQGQSC